MSYLFFPVHECLVCISSGFLLLMWQQERWHGWRGFKVGQKIEILDPTLRLQLILSPHANDILFSLFLIDKIALCDFLKLFRLL